MPYDRNGDRVYAEDVLSREELAEYQRQRRERGSRTYGRRGHDAEPTYTWAPTEADIEAGRTE